jgi:hypothetical protein
MLLVEGIDVQIDLSGLHLNLDFDVISIGKQILRLPLE